MKQYWLLIVTLLFLAIMVGLERKGAEDLRQTRTERDRVKRMLQEAEARAQDSAREGREYDAVREAAVSIRRQIVWETDSGRILQQLGAAANEAGIRLTSSRFQADSASVTAVAGGAFLRLKFDVNAVGAFPGVLDFMARVERSKQPMIIDSFTLNADRDGSGRGQARFMVSCLVPAPQSSGKKTP
jgi:Tfp pilus assembly protein PilO